MTTGSGTSERAFSRLATAMGLTVPQLRRLFGTTFRSIDELTPESLGSLGGYLYTTDDLSVLAQMIAKIRTDAYTRRLAELGRRIGLEPGELPQATIERIAAEAARSAQSIVETHNRDVVSAAAQRKDLGQWEANRAAWKSKQVALTEYNSARASADVDFITQNDLRIGGHVEPGTAVCPDCRALVAEGEMEPERAGEVAGELPLHINCDHSISWGDDLTTALGDRTRVWLGNWLEQGGADTAGTGAVA